MEMRDPDARNGKMLASRTAAGRNGRARLHVCVEWMVPPSGSWAVMPGMTVRLFVKGESVVMKCPVAPVLRIAGDFGGEEA